ncbi:MAG: amidase [Actinomycetota bacterium]|nr:amidase [Actinomycetota bacterium]
MDDRLTFMDATAQASLVVSGEVSPAELVDEAISRVEAVNGQLNAVIHERFEAARREAPATPPGPFRGVPILLKDLGAPMAGEPLNAGLRVAKEAGYRAPRNSFIVDKLQGAGFVILGRTNCPELGTTITTEPLAYGPSLNPYAPEHTTGGSSGGSAAAVASGMVPVAHGNDGGGSIRIPASCCGLVGLKPSRGRVSPGPEPGEASWAGATIDHVLTRSVRDSAAVLDVLAGEMPGDLFVAPRARRPFAEEVGAPPGTLRIGWLDEPARESAVGHPDTARAARQAASLLESLGHEVEEAHPAAMAEPDFQRNFMVLVSTAIVSDLDHWSSLLGRRLSPDELEPDNTVFHALGSSIPASTYLESVLFFEAWRRAMAAFWTDDGYDLLCTPVLAFPPARIGELSEPGVGQQRVIETLQFTAEFNVTGQPAISLPLSWSDEGLPIGVQLVAAYGREDVLIQVASQLEQAAPWSMRVPAVHP